ncbi:Acyl-CoA dehydrogenase, short-chain specific [Rhodococcus sp. B50]|nr:Acyl-CoA dehydrogenase, short-chain specific [Rhodococcus sp. B50]
MRDVPVFGRHDQRGHCEVVYDDVRVPAENILGEEGDGFAMAQARLRPGRIHHRMRALGAAERALALRTTRAQDRVAFDKTPAEQGVVQYRIAESRVAIDQARLLCRLAAETIDERGNKAAVPWEGGLDGANTANCRLSSPLSANPDLGAARSVDLGLPNTYDCLSRPNLRGPARA